MTEQEKFKKLLEYFVAHLEFCVTDQKVGDGYNRYIKDIKHFNRSGQGHKGQNIQNQIKEWESYTNGDICININPTVYKGRGCYLNWEDTAINVNALWSNDTIVGLKIVKDSYPISNAKDVLSYSIQDLGLLDNNPPNENLKAFFDRFNELIIQWNEEQKSTQGMKQIQPYIDLLKSSKNIILTGAPGTGKTFLAKQIAKQLIGVKTDEELEESGQFDFVQFHPSYDYTDFVEGLRPTPPDENGIIGFEIKDGIFKSFCQKASEAKFSEIVDNFDVAWESLLTAVRNNIAQGALTTIGSWDYGLSSKDSLKYSSVNTPSQYNFTITKKNVYDSYQGKQARPSGAFQKDMEDVVQYLKDNFGLVEFVNEKENSNNGIKNYVFVIDEINRGEISKIFGELFFSIDPSYRGKKGSVKTQYSNLHNDENEVFYVPENVFIIGSMNDIDRSVESFDFAMRRRFTWIEITSEQSADNMNLPQDIKEKMLNLNKQISNTDGLNSSYHIGAAYFLDSNGNASQDIDNIWNLRIEPLLKEYLRGMPDSIDKTELLKNAFTA
ncbi:MAG: AAA family ATPase [Verrucomicrobia bacterium]|nr:AAA family ATPase [Verrucomicrobiota bacterium]